MVSGDPGVSSKRVITAVAALIVFGIAIVDLFTDRTITDYVFQGVTFIAMAGLGSIALESFSKNNGSNSGSNSDSNEKEPGKPKKNSPKIDI